MTTARLAAENKISIPRLVEIFSNIDEVHAQINAHYQEIGREILAGLEEIPFWDDEYLAKMQEKPLQNSFGKFTNTLEKLIALQKKLASIQNQKITDDFSKQVVLFSIYNAFFTQLLTAHPELRDKTFIEARKACSDSFLLLLEPQVFTDKFDKTNTNLILTNEQKEKLTTLAKEINYSLKNDTCSVSELKAIKHTLYHSLDNNKDSLKPEWFDFLDELKAQIPDEMPCEKIPPRIYEPQLWKRKREQQFIQDPNQVHKKGCPNGP